MGNISFIQVIVFLIVMLLIFGDLSKVLGRFKTKINELNVQKKRRKKGS